MGWGVVLRHPGSRWGLRGLAAVVGPSGWGLWRGGDPDLPTRELRRFADVQHREDSDPAAPSRPGEGRGRGPGEERSGGPRPSRGAMRRNPGPDLRREGRTETLREPVL